MPDPNLAPDGLRELLGPQLVDLEPQSIYQWSPVFRATFAPDRAAVIKRSLRNPAYARAIATVQRAVRDAGVATVNPLEVGVDWPALLPAGTEEEPTTWIGYPWIDGPQWDGSTERLVEAGRYLGALHRVGAGLTPDGLARFSWPEPEDDSIDEDVTAVTEAGGQRLPDHPDAARRWAGDLRRFPTDILPRFHGGDPEPDLVWLPGSLDVRAENLIFSVDGPVLVDWEKTEWMPRLLDLAFSVVFFAHETAASPGRLLTRDEWLAFVTAYLDQAPPLTADEHDRWLDAVTYIRLEEGTWFLTDGAEWDLSEAHAHFLLDLLQLDDTRFAWPA